MNVKVRRAVGRIGRAGRRPRAGARVRPGCGGVGRGAGAAHANTRAALNLQRRAAALVLAVNSADTMCRPHHDYFELRKRTIYSFV